MFRAINVGCNQIVGPNPRTVDVGHKGFENLADAKAACDAHSACCNGAYDGQYELVEIKVQNKTKSRLNWSDDVAPAAPAVAAQ